MLTWTCNTFGWHGNNMQVNEQLVIKANMWKICIPPGLAFLYSGCFHPFCLYLAWGSSRTYRRSLTASDQLHETFPPRPGAPQSPRWWSTWWVFAAAPQGTSHLQWHHMLMSSQPAVAEQVPPLWNTGSSCLYLCSCATFAVVWQVLWLFSSKL